jgi:hypothetical protein
MTHAAASYYPTAAGESSICFCRGTSSRERHYVTLEAVANRTVVASKWPTISLLAMRTISE